MQTAHFPWKEQRMQGSVEGRGGRVLLMTACTMALDGPGIDVKVGRNVYKDSCPISRQWNRCPRGVQKSDTNFLGGSVHVTHGGWYCYYKKMSGINHRPPHRCHCQIGRLAVFQPHLYPVSQDSCKACSKEPRHQVLRQQNRDRRKDDTEIHKT